MRDPDWSLGSYVRTEIRYADEAEGGDGDAKGKGKKKGGGKKKKKRKSKFHPEDDDEEAEEDAEEEAAAAATGRRIDHIVDRFEWCVYVLVWIGVSICIYMCTRTGSTSYNNTNSACTNKQHTGASPATRPGRGGARRCASSAAPTRTCFRGTSKRCVF